jgi:hypothetical protein
MKFFILEKNSHIHFQNTTQLILSLKLLKNCQYSPTEGKKTKKIKKPPKFFQ